MDRVCGHGGPYRQPIACPRALPHPARGLVARAGALWLALLAAVFAAAPARAQSVEASAAPPAPASKQALAVRLTGAPPRVDGRLDEEVWRQGRPITDFIQKEPVEGAVPRERTEVVILYDDTYLYVGLRMFADDPAAIQRNVSRRDVAGGQSEHIWVSFDTYHDRRTAYSFGVTAAGGRIDWYHPRDDETDIDQSYDPVWEAHAVVDSLGWTAEMRIPFSQLRFNAGDEQVWGLNIDRWIPSRNEDDFWIPVPRNVSAWSSRMGELRGIRGIRPSSRVELLPYAASNATVTSGADPNNPFNPDGRTGEIRAGGDLKMGLGPSMTLQATVNPDFGQVEGDPAVVNLSAFEVFFDERRPFFTEGSQLLRGSGPAYFYSRRIGASPRGDASGDYVDRPGFSTILGAAKLTGRTRSGLSIGGLTAITARETARTYDTASAGFGRTEVAPVTGFGVFRAQQEFGPSQSVVGAMITAVRRDVDAGSALAGEMPRQAVTGGADWNLRWDHGTYEVGGYLGFSHVTGDAPAIAVLQQRSARYFQRPDQTYATYDTTRTALDGWTAGLSAGKNNGRHWLWGAFVGAESPGLELNDIGRISTADGVIGEGSLRYRETRPGRVFRNYGVSLNSVGEWNFGGERQLGEVELDANATWKNQWSTTATFWVDVRSQDERLTRGGPTMGTARSWVTIWSLNSNFAAKTQWRARVYYGRDELAGLTYRLSGSLSVRPGPRWSLSLAPNYLRAIDPRQYVMTVPDPLATATFGNRYVFAFLDESNWSMPIRFNYAFTPDLTLELYGEPFLASGRFTDHGQLAAPGGTDLVAYAGGTPIPDLDFNLASFRSNAVLRWEWRPGSTLFLVFQQRRARETSLGRLVRIGDLFNGLTADGDTFLAIKVNYWLSAR